MLLLVLSGNAVGTFIGWEIAGLCSYLLIAYYYERPVAAQNATRVFVTNRIGDAAFLLGIGLSYAWAGDVNWARLTSASAQLSTGQATVIALCFAVAACVKSAQIPFTPWLARAMEGPTPSSAIFYGAVMVHAGLQQAGEQNNTTVEQSGDCNDSSVSQKGSNNQATVRQNGGNNRVVIRQGER